MKTISDYRANPEVVAQRLQDLGLRFERHDNVRLMSKMAFGMFDTRKSHKCVLLCIVACELFPVGTSHSHHLLKAALQVSKWPERKLSSLRGILFCQR